MYAVLDDKVRVEKCRGLLDVFLVHIQAALFWDFVLVEIGRSDSEPLDVPRR